MSLTTEQWVMCFVVLCLLQVVVVAIKVKRVCTWTDVRDGALVYLGLMAHPVEAERKSH